MRTKEHPPGPSLKLEAVPGLPGQERLLRGARQAAAQLVSCMGMAGTATLHRKVFKKS